MERLRARGVPVRYDVYPDEGHGFTRPANAAFFEQHLQGHLRDQDRA